MGLRNNVLATVVEKIGKRPRLWNRRDLRDFTNGGQLRRWGWAIAIAVFFLQTNFSGFAVATQADSATVSTSVAVEPYSETEPSLKTEPSLLVEPSQNVDWEKLELELKGFDIHPELQASVFAAEPQFVNPTNIDVDHLGRVWVCEAVNYRNKIRNGDKPERSEGDRIVVLQDTDSDGRVDRSTTFFQSRDIDSPHGICVLGNRVILSAGESVRILTDDDGDLKSDRNEVLFTGIGGVQHDHGIHAFVFGPDGKLYFNFGNEGRQLLDKDRKPIRDKSGKLIRMDRPYQNGMIFRCNLDGSDVETLAWNFRNNWEVCVDSFGRMWQSDNDDDGNRSTRINYVVPYGNYGFSDEFTGAGWRANRIGQSSLISDRHWHQNDPGVMPNLLVTGAGSPTGIAVNEGSAIGDWLENQLIHCDAGPNVVRTYPVQQRGAGFEATSIALLDGSKKNQWFRPSDVCVAPDGSLLVADWYDPGVGGHRMQDIEGGRIYRLNAKGAPRSYEVPQVNLESPDGILDALSSPNQATRYMAFQAIGSLGDEIVNPLLDMAENANLRLRARAMWALAHHFPANSNVVSAISAATRDSAPEIRATAYRIASQASRSPLSAAIWDRANWADPSPRVRCELMIAMRQPGGLAFDVGHWTELVSQCAEDDEWSLETAGLSAEGHWDQCIASLKQQDWWNLKLPLCRKMVWRSRSSQTPELIVQALTLDSSSRHETAHMIRSLEQARQFLPPKQHERVDAALKKLAFETEFPGEEIGMFVRTEALLRVAKPSLTDEETHRIEQWVQSIRGTQAHWQLVRKFRFSEEYSHLLNMALETESRQFGVDIVNGLLDLEQEVLLRRALRDFSKLKSEKFDHLADLIADSGNWKAIRPMFGLAKSNHLPLANRKKLIMAMGRNQATSKELLKWVESSEYDEEVKPALVAALHNSVNGEVRSKSRTIFPAAEGDNTRPIPVISDLARLRGNAEPGAGVFFSKEAQCSNCHLVDGKGKQVGPDLSEIGSKLTRSAMYESILYPSAGVSHGYENWVVATLDGDLLTGLLVSDDGKQVTIQNADGIKRTIKVEDIEERKIQSLSLMPEGLHNSISDQQLADLVAYLMGLKKK